MKENFLKLTSVKLFADNYKKFKKKCLDTEITLQELVNTSIFLYNEKTNFDQIIHDALLTIKSGSL